MFPGLKAGATNRRLVNQAYHPAPIGKSSGMPAVAFLLVPFIAVRNDNRGFRR
jgi:hypothetical protein